MVTGFLIALFLCVLANAGFGVYTCNRFIKRYAEVDARLHALGARIPSPSEWEAVKSMNVEFRKLPTAEEFQRIRSLAEQAFDLVIGTIPDSGIAARKVGNLAVTTGVSQNGIR